MRTILLLSKECVQQPPTYTLAHWPSLLHWFSILLSLGRLHLLRLLAMSCLNILVVSGCLFAREDQRRDIEG